MNNKLYLLNDFQQMDKLTQETGIFAYEIYRLKKEKINVIDELMKRGKELQICCRKIKQAGGMATKSKDKKLYIVKGSFAEELYDPKKGSYEIGKTNENKEINPELADEIEKIHQLTFGLLGSKLTQLTNQFEMTCKKFWVTE